MIRSQFVENDELAFFIVFFITYHTVDYICSPTLKSIPIVFNRHLNKTEMKTPIPLKILNIVFLLFLSFSLFSQKNTIKATEQNVDSLEQAIIVSTDHMKQAMIYEALGAHYNATSQLQKARKTFLKLRQLAIEHNLYYYEITSYTSNSAYYFGYGKYDSLKITNLKALEIAKKHGFDNLTGLAMGNLGLAYAEIGQSDSALIYYEQAIEKIEEDLMKLRFISNTANTYHTRKDYYKAIELYEKALKLAKKNQSNWALGIIYTNIGMVQTELLEYKAAFENYQKGLELKKEVKNYKSMGYSYRTMAGSYIDMDSLDAAKNACFEALKVTESFKDTVFNLSISEKLLHISRIQGDFQQLEHYTNEGLRLSSSSKILSDLYEVKFLIGLIQMLNHKKKYKKALEHITQIIKNHSGQIFESANLKAFTQKNIDGSTLSKESYENILLELYTAQKGMSQYKEALTTFEALQSFRDSILIIQNLEQSKILNAKFRVSEKENELKVLEATKNAELKAKQIETTFYTTLAISSAILAIGLFFFMQRFRNQKNQLSTQNRLIKAQEKELRSLDELKSRFFANVSHEFRTPVSLILGPISTILKRNKLENRDFTLLQLAKQNCNNLLKLVGEILDLSKLESGNLQLVEEKTALYPTIRRIASSFESLADNKGIGFQLNYEADQQLQIKLDIDKFKAVLNNLLSNAFKFTPKDGSVKLSIHDKGQQLLFQITDTGKGIKEEDLPHIFNRFYQTTDEKGAAQGGTGIGLALCHEFAKLFDGRLWVESVWGKGSTFYFEMPKKEMLGALPDKDALSIKEAIVPLTKASVIDKKEGKSPLPNQISKQTILVVEDNKDLQDYLRIVLEEQYNVLISNNGQEAIELLDRCFSKEAAAEKRPSLVLSDVMMPLMDGFQLLEKIKQDDRTRLLPVIMLTAKAELRDRLHALRIGVDDYMPKPFEEEELLVRIENLLHNTNERLATLSKQGKTKEAPAHSVAEITWLAEQETLLRSQLTNPDFNASRWAGEVALSERQLQRKLKSLTGLSPRMYLVEMRLNEARTLLEDRQFDTVAEVAYAVGFSHADSFTRNFKKRYGKLPSGYLNENS